MAKKKPLSIQQAILQGGGTPEYLAKVINRALHSSNLSMAMRAMDMILKLNGQYQSKLIVSGTLQHDHALDIPSPEKQLRLDTLNRRMTRTAVESAIDVIATPIVTAPSPAHEDKKKK